MAITQDAVSSDPGDVALDVRPLTARVGAEVVGLDLRRPLGPATVAAIRAALLERFVLFFPGQHLDIDQQLAFTGQFGRVNPSHPIPGTGHADHPAIYQPRSTAADTRPPSWHADHVYMDEPSSIASLKAVQLPSSGGDTLWASLVVAFERLPRVLQEVAERLTVLHEPPAGYRDTLERVGPGRWNDRAVERLETTEHPLVVLHPESGRKALLLHHGVTSGVDTVTIKGVSTPQSRALVALFMEHVVQPEHTVRYRWTDGAVALWDNRVTLHRPVADYDPGEARILHRVSLEGTRPVAARQPGDVR